MCGICGFSERNDSVLNAMLDSLQYRGPDATCVWFSNEISLGMQRLSIVDLAASQPVFNETKDVVVIMNGEIYNYPDLYETLIGRGHTFQYNHSDTELIPHLYEEYGVDWVKYVNGMFAVALWDRSKNKLFLFRDRIGKKPLYYSHCGKFIAFASEIKALLKHPNVSTSVDIGSLCDYFAKKTTIAPNTIYSSVKQVLPGHYLCWDGNLVLDTKYWDVRVPLSGLCKDEFTARFLDLLQNSVLIRTYCDVEFGAYLSGGTDSSSVVSTLVHQGAKKVKTFCLGYSGSAGNMPGKNDDVAYAAWLSKRLGTDHHLITISPQQFADAVPKIISAFDEPFSGTISTYFVSQLIQQHVKVALSGDGADEIFGSYLSHRIAPTVSKLLSTCPQLIPDGGKWRKNLFVFNDAEVRKLLTVMDPRHYGSPNVADFSCVDDSVNQVLFEDQTDLLPNQGLPFVDRLSMAHSVEVRCPYLDYRIIELVNSMPGNMKVSDSGVKLLQRDALRDTVVPSVIVDRKKEGFVQPIYHWMQGELSAWVDAWLDDLPGHIINRNYVKDIDRVRSPAKIWNLVCFSIWWATCKHSGM